MLMQNANKKAQSDQQLWCSLPFWYSVFRLQLVSVIAHVSLSPTLSETPNIAFITNVMDVTSKVGDDVKFDAASPFFLVYLCQHQNKKNVMSTIMMTVIFDSFLCIFAKY